MTRTEFIEALKKENKLCRRLTGNAVTNHVTINGFIIYYSEISRIVFSDLTCSIFVRGKDGHDSLLLLMFYSDIKRIGA